MKPTSADLKAGILSAIGHPNRIRILEYLREQPRCNCEIAPALGLEQSNLSRHLKILVLAGVLVSWKDGLRVNFKIADERIARIIDIASDLAKKQVRQRAAALNL